MTGISTDVIENNEGYYIAPYQRGFKWGNYVHVMLHDIKNAYEKNSEKDYYLNFISIVENTIEDKRYLELIDGQQRITTIVLFWSIVNKYKTQLGIQLSPKYDGLDKDLTDTLLISRLKSGRLDSLFELNRELPNTQDSFYLDEAIKEIHKFLNELKDENYNFQSYFHYFSHQVKIIINEEKLGISAAEIFGNLNSNKVDLTDTYLVKGLLLSLASRESENQESKRYREIMEKRTVMGRLWDEMFYWINTKQVQLYFFGKVYEANKSMHPLDILIKMAADELEIEINYENEDSFPLFNSLYKNISSYSLASDFLEKVKLKYWFFRKMFESKQHTIHNLLGLILINEEDNLSNRLSILNDLANKIDDDDLLKYLKPKHLENIKDIDVNQLMYKKKDENNITKILLTISALDDELGSFTRFNFFNFLNTENGWSIEHIFPQNISVSKQTKIHIDSWIRGIKNDPNVRQQDISRFTKTTNQLYKLEGSKTDKSIIHELNNKVSETFDRIVTSLNIEIDSIGNLALLGLIDNIKLSNSLFEEKKYKLLSYSAKGSFVPKHTFGIFNKSIIGNNSLVFEQNNIWTNIEIKQHKEWLCEKIESIKIKLKN